MLEYDSIHICEKLMLTNSVVCESLLFAVTSTFLG